MAKLSCLNNYALPLSTRRTSTTESKIKATTVFLATLRPIFCFSFSGRWRSSRRQPILSRPNMSQTDCEQKPETWERERKTRRRRRHILFAPPSHQGAKCDHDILGNHKLFTVQWAWSRKFTRSRATNQWDWLLDRSIVHYFSTPPEAKLVWKTLSSDDGSSWKRPWERRRRSWRRVEWWKSVCLLERLMRGERTEATDNHS